MTALPKDCIATPYCPDYETGEFGWLWLEGEGDFPHESDWPPVMTWLPDGKDAEPQLRILRPDTDDEHHSADDFAGCPYLPAIRPQGAPRAGLEVTVRLAHGASATVTYDDRGPHVDRLRREVMALLTQDEGNDLLLAHAALRDCLAALYGTLRSDLECACILDDGAPLLDTADDEARPFLDPLVSAIQAAESAVGRILPDDTPDWLIEAIDTWRFGDAGWEGAGDE